MNKGLEALERLIGNKVFISLGRIQGKKQFAYDINIIEKELKDKEQQDSVLKTLKEVIAFGQKLPDIEIDDDENMQFILGAVGMRIQRQMENKERELLRKFVLETCFPKELKELEELQQVLDDFKIYNTMNLIDTLKNISFLEKQNAINSKKLKALEIIKEKRVNVDNFLNRIKSYTTYKEYKMTLCERYRILVFSDKELTEEEYNLLKEVLL